MLHFLPEKCNTNPLSRIVKAKSKIHPHPRCLALRSPVILVCMSTSPTNSSAPASVSAENSAQASSSSRPATQGASERTVSYRVAPSIAAFIITGVLLGLIAAFLLTWFGPGSEKYTFSAIFGVMAFVCCTIGATLGALLALVLDKISLKRARTYRAVPED